MNIDEILNIHEEVMVNEGTTFINTALKTIKKMAWNKAQDFLRSQSKDFFDMLDKEGISKKKVLNIVNKNMKTSFRSEKPIISKRVTESIISEGFSDWWKEATSNLYGALSFYPLLTTFLELDKVIKSSGDANIQAMIIYFIIWVAVITGKVVSGKLVNKNDVKASLHPAQVGGR